MAEGAGIDVWPARTAEPPAPAVRLVSAGAEEALERFSDPELLAAGKVNVISLEAVEARFGRRWELRRDQVYDFATRVLQRGVGDQGFFLRVSPTDFFIVHPDLGRLAGQAACLRYLREVLNHFLGEDQMAASGVLQVTRIHKGQLEAKQMDARVHAHAEIDEAALDDLPEPGAEPEAAGAASKSARADDEPGSRSARTAAAKPADERSVDRWTPFIAADGRQLRVTASLEPVYELKGFTRI
ncbi:MAG: hypothetical protein JWQ29_276, partial [Phenylobacterium sp.]|nr:hypothetical protein [Phenylobacterium sp.]